LRLILASVCILMTIGRASAAEPSDSDKAVVVSLVRKVVKAWSSNDIDAATPYISPSIVITDGVAPYLFRGPSAMSDWLKAFAANAKTNDITDPWETLGRPMEVEVDGPHAYAAFPAVYGFKVHGRPVRENSTVVVTLEKSETDWSIASWTWSKR
jgi:hypothetical protein